MKKNILLSILMLLIIMFFVACTSNNEFIKLPQNQDSDREVIELDGVKVFQNELIFKGTDEALQSVLLEYGAEVTKENKTLGVYLLKTNKDIAKIFNGRKFILRNGVEYLEPNYAYELPEYKVNGLDEEQLKAFERMISRAVPDDEYYGYQWTHEKIKTESAWNAGYTGKNVVVAIFDTGVDASHPDLQGRFVDGFNAGTREVIPAGESVDYDIHGTHVAGAIAANKDNGIGIAGVAPEAMIMPIPYIGVTTDSLSLADAIVWAVANDADIFQNSWGSSGGYSLLRTDAYNYALENGVFVSFSSGNSHTINNTQFPQGPGIPAIGVSDVNDHVDYMSNGGESLSVVAPGVFTLSTVPVGTTSASGYPMILGKPYSFMSGTSMAAPNYSGLAALVLEKYPNATPYQVRKIIENSADEISSARGSNWNNVSGYGRINVEKAMMEPLPSSKGGNLTVEVTNHDGTVAIPNVYVTLSRNGLPFYFSITNLDGNAVFTNIDPDVYDVIIGGPDYQSSYSYNYRMEEQIGMTINNVSVGENDTLAVNLSSAFEGTLSAPIAENVYTLNVLDYESKSLLESFELGVNTNFSIEPASPVQYLLQVTTATPLPLLPEPFMTEDFETGSFETSDWKWNLSGDSSPFVQATETTPNSTYSAQFGNIDHNQESVFATDITLAEGDYFFSFDYKVSSEPDYDYFEVKIDDDLVLQESGEKDWANFKIELSGGDHSVEFKYWKDGGASTGDDTAWVDNIEIAQKPANYGDYDLTGTIYVNGNQIAINQNLYISDLVDGNLSYDYPWTIF